MRASGVKLALAFLVELTRHLGRLSPVSGPFVNAQERQQSLCGQWGALQSPQLGFSAVQDARFDIVHGEVVLRSLAVRLADVTPRQQMLVNAHSTFVLATAAKQIAQGEMQFRGVGVALYRFNEGVNRLVLLLVE